MPIVLAVDIGSSSVRCTAYQYSSTHPTPVSVTSSQITSPPCDANGRYNATTLASSTEEAITVCLSNMSTTQQTSVIAMGFDCFAMSLVGSNGNGTAMTHVFSYAERSKPTVKYAHRLRQLLTNTKTLVKTHQRTGAPIHSAYAGPTLMRLLHDDPDVYHSVTRWQSFTSYLLQQWIEPTTTTDGGHPFIVPVSYSEASWMGIYNRIDRCWDAALLSTLGMTRLDQEKLAPVQDYDSLPRNLRLSKAMLRKWPALSKVRLYLGFGDGAMANIGSKCTNIDRVAVTIGTSAALRVVVPTVQMHALPLPTGLWCYAIDKDHALVGGALTDGGSIHAFIKAMLPLGLEEKRRGSSGGNGSNNGSSSGSMAGTTTESLAPTHDLIVLPFLSGERSPGWNGDARATIHGISRATTKADLRQALYESVCLRLCAVFHLMVPYLNQNAENIVVVASGTALKSNPMWKQMMADSLGHPLIVENTSEATSRGVAVMVIKHLQKTTGLHHETLNENNQAEIWNCNAGMNEVYREELLKQTELYGRLYGNGGDAPSEEVVETPKNGVTVGLMVGGAMACGVVLGCMWCQFRRR